MLTFIDIQVQFGHQLNMSSYEPLCKNVVPYPLLFLDMSELRMKGQVSKTKHCNSLLKKGYKSPTPIPQHSPFIIEK